VKRQSEHNTLELLKRQFTTYGDSGLWRGVAATRCVRSTKLLYAGPG